jgi:hypothetical protein
VNKSARMAWAVLAKNKLYRAPSLADVAAAYRVCRDYGFLPGLLGKEDGATVELGALETRTRKKSFKTEIVTGKRATAHSILARSDSLQQRPYANLSVLGLTGA